MLELVCPLQSPTVSAALPAVGAAKPIQVPEATISRGPVIDSCTGPVLKHAPIKLQDLQLRSNLHSRLSQLAAVVSEPHANATLALLAAEAQAG